MSAGPAEGGAPGSAVRGRYAPSPTGRLHLGNARTALLAWLQVRSQGGRFVLRMEDLDRQRSSEEAAGALLKDLRWLGLDWDEGPDLGGPVGPYTQSQRQELYQDALEGLQSRDLLYPCYCTRAELRNDLTHVAGAPHPGEEGPPYAGTCRCLTSAERAARESAGRRPSRRFRVIPGLVCYNDGLAGRICQDVAEAVGDFVVQRADGVMAYQLAVVVDDAAMGITHVLRGADLISSTPRQLLLYQALGLTSPEFVHAPLLYGPDGARLSKRHGDTTLATLREAGISPTVVTGYLAWLSGLVPRGTALLPNSLVSSFRLDHVSREPAVVEPGNLMHDLQNW